MSKAADKSRRVRQVTCWWLIALMMLSGTERRVFSVECYRQIGKNWANCNRVIWTVRFNIYTSLITQRIFVNYRLSHLIAHYRCPNHVRWSITKPRRIKRTQMSRWVCSVRQWRDWSERPLADVLINHVIEHTWVVVYAHLITEPLSLDYLAQSVECV